MGSNPVQATLFPGLLSLKFGGAGNNFKGKSPGNKVAFWLDNSLGCVYNCDGTSLYLSADQIYDFSYIHL